MSSANAEDSVITVLKVLRREKTKANVAESIAVKAEMDYRISLECITMYIEKLKQCSCAQTQNVSVDLDEIRSKAVSVESNKIHTILMNLKKGIKEVLKHDSIDKMIDLRRKLVTDERRLTLLNEQCECKYGSTKQAKSKQTKPRVEISDDQAAAPRNPDAKLPMEGGRTDNQTISSASEAKLKKENDELKRAVEARTKELNDLKAEIDHTRRNGGNLNVGKHREAEELKKVVQAQRREIEELKTRLSTLAGSKLRENNPDIADLSDPYRPTKLGELFRRVYDDDWTVAFEELDKKKLPEADIISFLTDIIKTVIELNVYPRRDNVKLGYHLGWLYLSRTVKEMCKVSRTRLSKDVTNNILTAMKTPTLIGPTGKEYSKDKYFHPTTTQEEHDGVATKYTRDITKGLAILAVPYITSKYEEKVFGDLLKRYKTYTAMELKKLLSNWKIARTTAVNNYVAKVVKYLWLMEVQDPPMDLLWQWIDDKFDKDRFSFYTASGTRVAQCVWPAVLLHSAGPLMTKGIAQGMN